MTDESHATGVLDKSKPPKTDTEKKAHPWRVCPIGQYYVKTHQLTVPPIWDTIVNYWEKRNHEVFQTYESDFGDTFNSVCLCNS